MRLIVSNKVFWALMLLFFMSFMWMFSWAVDPYGVLHRYGDNRVGFKSAALTNPRLFKVENIKEAMPSVVLLGGESVFKGFNSNAGFIEGRSIYNMGLPDASLYEIYRLLKYSKETVGIKTAVISLEFSIFNAHFSGEENEFDEYLLSDGYFAEIRKLWKSLLSPSVFLDSIDQVLSDSDDGGYTGNGSLTNDYLNALPPLKYNSKFQQEEEYYLSTGYFPGGPKKYRFRDLDTDADSFQYFRRILEYSKSNDIELFLYIPPYHSRHIEVIYEAGLLGKYEEWKRNLVDIVSVQNDGTNVSIFDFSGDSVRSSESVPLLGDAQSIMSWYWSGVNFKPKMGELILKGIFKNDKALPNMMLSKENIDRHIISQRKSAFVYRVRNRSATRSIVALSTESSHRRPLVSYKLQLIANALKLIEEGEEDKNSLVEQLGYESISELQTALRQVTGVEFDEYLAIYSSGRVVSEDLDRVLTAKLLLTNTYLALSKVALVSGFDNMKHFSSTFKAYTSQRPLQYRVENGRDTLRDVPRVEIAKNLLETTTLTTDDVVEGAGFGNLTIMKKLFKENTGLLPSEYRERSLVAGDL